MYSEKFSASLQAVAAKREENSAYEPARMIAEQKDALLKKYHPDYRADKFSDCGVGGICCGVRTAYLKAHRLISVMR